jgi:hypothetical protein
VEAAPFEVDTDGMEHLLRVSSAGGAVHWGIVRGRTGYLEEVTAALAAEIVRRHVLVNRPSMHPKASSVPVLLRLAEWYDCAGSRGKWSGEVAILTS